MDELMVCLLSCWLPAGLPKAESDTFQQDSLYSLQTWEKDMKKAEELQRQQPLFVEENMPPVRGSNCPVSMCKVKMASINIHVNVLVKTRLK